MVFIVPTYSWSLCINFRQVDAHIWNSNISHTMNRQGWLSICLRILALYMDGQALEFGIVTFARLT